MSIESQLEDLKSNLDNAKAAVVAKGGTVGDTGLKGLATSITNTIPSVEGTVDIPEYLGLGPDEEKVIALDADSPVPYRRIAFPDQLNAVAHKDISALANDKGVFEYELKLDGEKSLYVERLEVGRDDWYVSTIATASNTYVAKPIMPAYVDGTDYDYASGLGTIISPTFTEDNFKEQSGTVSVQTHQGETVAPTAKFYKLKDWDLLCTSLHKEDMYWGIPEYWNQWSMVGYHFNSDVVGAGGHNNNLPYSIEGTDLKGDEIMTIADGVSLVSIVWDGEQWTENNLSTLFKHALAVRLDENNQPEFGILAATEDDFKAAVAGYAENHAFITLMIGQEGQMGFYFDPNSENENIYYPDIDKINNSWKALDNLSAGSHTITMEKGLGGKFGLNLTYTKSKDCADFPKRGTIMVEDYRTGTVTPYVAYTTEDGEFPEDILRIW